MVTTVFLDFKTVSLRKLKSEESLATCREINVEEMEKNKAKVKLFTATTATNEQNQIHVDKSVLDNIVFFELEKSIWSIVDKTSGTVIGQVVFQADKEAALLVYVEIIDKFRSNGYGTMVLRGITENLITNEFINGVEIEMPYYNSPMVTKILMKSGYTPILGDYSTSDQMAIRFVKL